MDERTGLNSAISRNENESEYEYRTEFIILNPKKFTVSFNISPLGSFEVVIF